MARYRFEDIAFNITDKRTPTPEDKELYIGLEHLDTRCLRVSRWGSAVDITGQKLIMRKGDVLFGRRNTYLRRAAIAPHDGLFSAHGMIFRPKTDVITEEFFPYFIVSNYFMDAAIRISVGSLSPTVNWKQLKELEFDIPDTDKQHKYAEFFAAIDRAKEAYKQLIVSTDELVKSQFFGMFGDYRTNSKCWPVLRFGHFATIDANMTTDYERYADYPHIGIDSITKDTGELVGYRTVKEDNVISGKYIFTPNHIIYSKIRPNLNKVALPDFDGLCSADAYPILANPKNCNKIYLATLLRSEYFLNYILGFSARSNMPKVNRQQISGFSAPLPPLELQNEFAGMWEQADKSKFEAKKALELLDVLYQNMEKQCFY